MKLRQILTIILVVVFMLCNSFQAFADGGVEVNPAYISGKIILGDYKYSDLVSGAYVYANANGGFNSSVQVKSDGTYTLTVNAPSDGTKRTYDIYARVYMKSGAQFDAGSHVSIDTVKGSSYTQDFSQELATLSVDGSFTNDDWTEISPFYNSGSSQYLYYYIDVSKSGTHSLLIPANIPFRWVWGYAAPKNTDKYTSIQLDKKEFTAKPGETVKLTWNGTFPDKSVIVTPVGVVRGSISYSPLPEGSLYSHNIWSTDNGYRSTSISKDGDFKFENYPSGKNRWLYVDTTFNQGKQSLRWPYSYINPGSKTGYFDLDEKGEAVFNISAKPAMVKGKLSITGIKSLKDVSSTPYMYTYENGTNGSANSQVDKDTGEYKFYLTPGSWNVGYCYGSVSFNNNGKYDEYLNSSMNYYDYTKTQQFNGALTVSALQVVDGYDMEIPTGMVTIKYISTDGSKIKSPYISGTMNEIVNGKQTRSASVNGYGTSDEVAEAQASIVAPPGTYTLNTTAVVNGSNVTFSPRSVVVIKGVHTVIEVNGPSLNVSSPSPELYTSDSAVTVKGTATDDVGVASVCVNGTEVAIKSTSNSNDPNEVGFEASVPLSDGPNKIEVKAKDTSGKEATDARFVYKDNSNPALNVLPSDGTVTSATSVTISGTATDDNKVTLVTINGLSVPFTSTNNPNDPNEVSFSKVFDIVKGGNNFTICATDNCKRSSTVTRLITNADKDITPPVFDTIQDINLELSSPSGNTYTLPIPKVKDNIDPKPKVTSDAPKIFPLGKTKVTWTATDSSGNSSTAVQNVIVSDTVKPDLVLPKDIEVNASGNMTPVDIGKATAKDISNVTITNDAPADGKFAIGTTDVTWTAVDTSGNTSKAIQKVTVLYTKPSIEVPKDITIEATGANTSISIGEATAKGASPISIVSDAPKDGKYPLGTTSIAWTATDVLGNSVTGIQKVTVVDTTRPVLTIPKDITIDATGVNTPVEIGLATATDIFDVSVTNDAPKDGKFPIGTTPVTWKAADANGNYSTAVQKVTVLYTKPSIEVPKDMTVEATGANTSVSIGEATAKGASPISIISDAPKDGKYPLGTTSIMWTATDALGNSVTGIQKVTIVDTTKPVLTIPKDITIDATSVNTPVEIGQATATDIFDVSVTNDAPDGGKFPIGTTKITWKAADANGNYSTAVQNITVLYVKPSIEVPKDMTVEATGANTSVSIGEATAKGVSPVSIVSDAPKDGMYPLGTTSITWTATDALGNSVTGIQKVIVSDTTKPVLTIPKDITTEAVDKETPVEIGQAAATDIFDVSITNDAPKDGKFPVGTTTVTWKAADANGNYSTAVQKITITDTTKPVISVPKDITTEATSVKTPVEIGKATATDIFDVSVTNDAPDGGFPIGTTTVTWKATDANGNYSTEVQKVTIVDTTKPVINAPKDIVVKAQGTKTYVSIGEASANDIFPVKIENDAPSDGMFGIGNTIVTWKATDSNGNISYATQKITVVSQLMYRQLTHYGNIEADNIFCNGSVRIHGSFNGNVISTTEDTVLITGQSKVDNILKKQPVQDIPVPSWKNLYEKTTLKAETMPNYSEFSNYHYVKSVMTRGKVSVNGLLVVEGDLNFNGDVNLNNAAIYCTGKVTFNGKLAGQGLVYSATGITNYGDINLEGQLITNGNWEVSGTSKISSWTNQEYLDYFVK